MQVILQSMKPELERAAAATATMIDHITKDTVSFVQYFYETNIQEI